MEKYFILLSPKIWIRESLLTVTILRLFFLRGHMSLTALFWGNNSLKTIKWKCRKSVLLYTFIYYNLITGLNKSNVLFCKQKVSIPLRSVYFRRLNLNAFIKRFNTVSKRSTLITSFFAPNPRTRILGLSLKNRLCLIVHGREVVTILLQPLSRYVTTSIPEASQNQWAWSPEAQTIFFLPASIDIRLLRCPPGIALRPLCLTVTWGWGRERENFVRLVSRVNLQIRKDKDRYLLFRNSYFNWYNYFIR